MPIGARRYSRCALVSNSGVLLNHQHGKEIDEAEAVFRFNDAPTEPYKTNVGTKETIRFVNDQFPGRAAANASLVNKLADYIVAYTAGPGEIAAMHTFHFKYPSVALYRVDNEIPAKVFSLFKSIYEQGWFVKGDKGMSNDPTTGGIGMLIALSMCDRIWAYGMASSSSMESSSYHYYDEIQPKDNIVHKSAGDNHWHRSFELEKDLWRKMAEKSSIDTGIIDMSEVAEIPGFSQVQCS